MHALHVHVLRVCSSTLGSIVSSVSGISTLCMCALLHVYATYARCLHVRWSTRAFVYTCIRHSPPLQPAQFICYYSLPLCTAVAGVVGALLVASAPASSVLRAVSVFRAAPSPALFPAPAPPAAPASSALLGTPCAI